MSLATYGTATIPAGETSVVVSHTFGSVDYRWIVTPTTDLGGRNWWPSDKAADSFKININSADLADHTFDWDLVPGIPLAEEGEYYCTVAEVKEVLGTEESTWDAEILGCIVAGDALIDGLLLPHDLTVPSPVPQNINSASRYFAAWLFRKRRDPAGAAAFKEEADGFLQAYIDDESEAAFKVVSA